MLSNKGVKFLNRDSDGYYFCGLCNKPHRISTSIEGGEHLVDHFDEGKTNDPLITKYYFCGECGKWHRDKRDHIQYRLYVKLHPSLKGTQNTGAESPSNIPLPETSCPREELMDVKEVIRYMTAGIAERQECLALAFDRGIGKGMKIEKWLLTEMMAKLVELRTSGRLERVEGEHKYPIKKTRSYEHCDFWWCSGGNEQWLEVKTVKSIDDLKGVESDLAKTDRLRHSDIFHHLSILFLLSSTMGDWTEQVTSTYSKYGLSCKADWSDMAEPDVRLRFMLFG